MINKDMDRFCNNTESRVGRQNEWRNRTSTEERQISGAEINTVPLMKRMTGRQKERESIGVYAGSVQQCTQCFWCVPYV